MEASDECRREKAGRSMKEKWKAGLVWKECGMEKERKVRRKREKYGGCGRHTWEMSEGSEKTSKSQCLCVTPKQLH